MNNGRHVGGSIAVFTVGAMLTSVASPQTQLPAYQVLDIGTLGGSEATAVDINDRGEVTGGAATADGWQHAFIYRDGAMIDLGTLRADRYVGGSSIGADINNRGEVAGQADTEDGSIHAVRYADGLAKDLGTLGGTYSSGYAINEKGQVAGISYLTDDAEYHAFRYSRSSGMSDLGTLGDSYSTGDGINDAGEVAGIYQLEFESHAYLYTHGTLVDLLPGKSSYLSSDAAVVINSAGHIAGSYRTDDATRSFIYRDGDIVDVGTLGGDFALASALNDDDQVVGDSTVASGDAHAFRWSCGKMRDLGTLGGTYSNGFAINRSGHVTGQAVTTAGEYHPFVFSHGVMTDLILPEGGFQGLGTAINASGQVTGVYQLLTGDPFAPYVFRGFIATPVPLLFSKLQDKASESMLGRLLYPSVRLATHYYNRSDLAGTCVALSAFTAQAGFISSNKKLAATMKQLATDARAIKTTLGCPNEGSSNASAPASRSAVSIDTPSMSAEERARALAWYKEKLGIDQHGILGEDPRKRLQARQ